MIYLISEKTLKQYSLINDNVDTCYIMPAIQLAQETGLQVLIGSNLLNTLCEMVANNNIKPDYKYLLDNYIANYLIYKTMAEIQIPLYGKFRNAGMLQSQDTQTQQIDLKNVQYLIDYYDYKATFYGNRLTEYLCAFSSKYPEYNKANNNEIPAQKEDYKSTLNI